MSKIETVILKNLIHNEEYLRKVLPFLKSEYFNDTNDKIIYQIIDNFVKKYNKNPAIESLEIILQNTPLPETQYEDVYKLLHTLKLYEVTDMDWLVDSTEKFCKDKSIYNAIIKSINIIDGKDKQLSKEGIPNLLQEALGTCFDISVGHDYIDDAKDRFKFYNHVEDKIPFDLDYFNKITKGGLPNKTLNICLAGTGVGKSLFMCHMASNVLSQNKNVLYITMEMAEERIAERIDANCFNIEMDQIKDLPEQMFNNRIKKFSEKSNGRLIIKEYPTASAHCGHFKSLMGELLLKRNFKPDIIFIDYLNICASSRLKPASGVNSYTYIKAIAEELRGLAVEFNLPVVSATQTTRSGYSNTDVDLTDTSESFGLPATADFMFALVTSEDLENLNQMMVKQLKNRYNDPTGIKRFMIGVDRSKMKLYDLETSAQSDLQDKGKLAMTSQGYDQSQLDKLFGKGDNSHDYTKIKV